MTGKKGRWILGISLAALLAVAGGSQVFFLARYPYFRKYAAQNGVTLREAREAWGHPDAISEQMMGLAVEASLENWDKVAALASEDRRTLVGTSKTAKPWSALTITTWPTPTAASWPTG